MNIGKNVNLRRKALNLSQENIAEAAGVTSTFICYVERGLKMPKLETAVLIAEALGCTVNDLIQPLKKKGD